MNAQKLRNNKIAVGNTKPRKDAIQVIENLRTAEFFCLVRSARNWEKSLNDRRDIMFTTYENEHSKVCKEFDRIFERHRLFDERVKTFQELKEELVTRAKPPQLSEPVTEATNIEQIEEISRPEIYKSDIVGTSKLIRIPKKQIIKIARRKGINDNNNKVNSVCIDNRLREEFFKDCKTTQHFEDTKLYELMYNEFDMNVYEKWDQIMKEVYEKGLNQK